MFRNAAQDGGRVCRGLSRSAISSPSLCLSVLIMSSVSLLSVYLSGASLILLTADYEDYNATFEYSFYSNTSIEDLDKFSERFIETEDEEGEDTGGQEQDVTVTTATTRVTTEQGWVKGHNAACITSCFSGENQLTSLYWTV
ncbi:hypothetical protein F7725_025633 [Dissostichus mawsoni]|uniref:Uncharacterized protein n=1 Tax=Dissostichus mawsoni TaxID=36200 RepID=A0A7J5XCM6_DISMA|nr:hypothetical protein F7725_025633 [Dissostichus mawsoni]